MDTVGRNKKAIADYIKNQLTEEIAADQISLKKVYGPVYGWQEYKSIKTGRFSCGL